MNLTKLGFNIIACAAILSTNASLAAPAEKKPGVRALAVASSSFANGGPIPKQFTGDGADTSPDLSWSKMPHGTNSVAVYVEDPDAPSGTWVHWILYNYPPTNHLPAGLPKGSSIPFSSAGQGKNDFGKFGYNGPLPPRHKLHHYLFRVFALDTMLDLQPGATKQQFLAALGNHILAQGVITGTYQR